MGTTHSVATFSRKIVKAAEATEVHAREIVLEGAQTAKVDLLAAAAAHGVKPGGKIAGGRWGVHYDLIPSATPKALVAFRGPFHLVENPTKSHQIGARGTSSAAKGLRRRKGAKALRFKDGGFASVVTHPGTQGKHIFRDSKLIIERHVAQAMAKKQRAVWKDAFK